MKSNQKVIKIITVSAVIFIFLLLASLIINLVKLSNAAATEARLNEELAAVKEKIEQQAADIDELESTEYLDWYAREHLNMKGRDEEAFTPEKKD